MTQAQAGELVHSFQHGWQNWDLGVRDVHPGLFEMFCNKAGQGRPQ